MTPAPAPRTLLAFSMTLRFVGASLGVAALWLAVACTL